MLLLGKKGNWFSTAKAPEGKRAVSGAQLEEKAGTTTPEALKPDSILRVMESHRRLYVGPLWDHICFSGEKNITQLHSENRWWEETKQIRAFFSYPGRETEAPEGGNVYKTEAKRTDLQCHSGWRISWTWWLWNMGEWGRAGVPE